MEFGPVPRLDQDHGLDTRLLDPGPAKSPDDCVAQQAAYPDLVDPDAGASIVHGYSMEPAGSRCVTRMG